MAAICNVINITYVRKFHSKGRFFCLSRKRETKPQITGTRENYRVIGIALIKMEDNIFVKLTF